jgi:hypothetical protein
MIVSPFNPNDRFPALVRPVESADRTMARLDLLADIAMETCPHCTVTVELLGKAIGKTHEQDCPESID